MPNKLDITNRSSIHQWPTNSAPSQVDANQKQRRLQWTPIGGGCIRYRATKIAILETGGTHHCVPATRQEHKSAHSMELMRRLGAVPMVFRVLELVYSWALSLRVRTQETLAQGLT